MIKLGQEYNGSTQTNFSITPHLNIYNPFNIHFQHIYSFLLCHVIIAYSLFGVCFFVHTIQHPQTMCVCTPLIQNGTKSHTLSPTSLQPMYEVRDTPTSGWLLATSQTL